jgi:transcriptional regulator with XRE-family HTH domain
MEELVDKERVSNKIKKALLKAELTQKDLADKLGVSQQLISNWINGFRNPKSLSLKKISKATGVPLNFFLENSMGDVKGTNFSINSGGQGNINTSKDYELLQKENELLKRELEIERKEKELLKKEGK